MKNEFGKLNQSESHKINAEFLYLDFALKAFTNVQVNLTDKLMFSMLQNLSENTIRTIRKQLVNEGVLRKSQKTLPHNEKIYEFNSIKKAIQLRKRLEKKFVNKIKSEINLPQGKIELDIEPDDVLLLKTNNQSGDQTIRIISKKSYKQNICPICFKKLRKFKHEHSNEMDKKCLNCKYNFYFDENNNYAIVRTEKY